MCQRGAWGEVVDERWKIANAAHEHTEVVVNRVAKSSGGLMATCYLESSDDSSLARLTADEVELRSEEIVQSLVENGRRRDQGVELVSWRRAVQDNVPVVYAVRDAQIQTISGAYQFRIYSITTTWNGREVHFECGSEVPRNWPEATPIVEGPILRVLGSLQFIRVQE